MQAGRSSESFVNLYQTKFRHILGDKGVLLDTLSLVSYVYFYVIIRQVLGPLIYIRVQRQPQWPWRRYIIEHTVLSFRNVVYSRDDVLPRIF